MSELGPNNPSPTAPSHGIPVAILVAIVIEVAFSLARIAMPTDWRLAPTYWLVSMGTYASTALLTTMGLAELFRRLPQHLATGAQIALFGSVAFVVLSLTGSLMNLATSFLGQKAEIVWKVQSYAYLLSAGVTAAGLIMAARESVRVAPLAIGLVVSTVALFPPPFLATEMRELFGKSGQYVYPLINLAQLALQTLVIREAARSATRELPAEPTAPFALLGSALRARVIAMFVLIAFTVFAVGGRSLGAMKVAMIAAPLINIAAFIVFAVAAARAARGLENQLQWMFGLATAASAWCAGVLSVQTVAVYQVLKGRADSWSSERDAELAQSLGLTMPLVATIGVVIALVATSAYVRKLGHHTVSDSIGPRTTTFVLLMAASVLIQTYGAPKAKSSGELIMYGLVAVAAGVAALLVAASLFKRASEATSTTALPTATVVP